MALLRAPVPIIIDTDMSIDTDDVGAMCVAHALEDRGEATILAVVHGTGLAEGVGAVSVINHFYGRDRIPIGAYRGPVGDPSRTPGPAWTNGGRGWYVDALLRLFPSPIRNASQVSDAVRVFRRALVDAPPGRSVTVVALGHATNLLGLLRSPPDDISPSTGVDLVRRRVHSLVWMGGSYWVSNRVEWNFGACGGVSSSVSGDNEEVASCGAYDLLPRLTYETVRQWPDEVPTIFLSFDIGFKVRSGGVLKAAHPARSPCRQAYIEFCGGTGGGGGLPEWCDKDGRNAWDLMAVVLAVRGTRHFYKLFPGRNALYAQSGRNQWHDDETWQPKRLVNHGHYQAWMSEKSYSAAAHEIDELLLPLPRATPPPGSPPAPLPPPSPPPPPLLPPCPPPSAQPSTPQMRSLPSPPCPLLSPLPHPAPSDLVIAAPQLHSPVGSDIVIAVGGLGMAAIALVMMLQQYFRSFPIGRRLTRISPPRSPPRSSRRTRRSEHTQLSTDGDAEEHEGASPLDHSASPLPSDRPRTDKKKASTPHAGPVAVGSKKKRPAKRAGRSSAIQAAAEDGRLLDGDKDGPAIHE